MYLGSEEGFAEEAESLLRRSRWRQMRRMAPHIIQFEKVSVAGTILLILSGWPYWERCLVNLLCKGLLP
jgi:hypothetical protein